MSVRKQISSCTVIQWLSITDVADLTGSGESTVRRWIKKNLLKAHKLGRNWKIDPSDYQTFMKNTANIQDY